MRIRTLLFITSLLACHLNLWPQTLTKQFPPRERETSRINASVTGDQAGRQAPSEASPKASGYPVAELVPSPPSGVPVRFEYSRLEKHGDIYTLTGNVTIHYKNYTLRADKIVFNRKTSEAAAQGNVELAGGRDDELITAARGSVNLDRETGTFYDVVGTIGARSSGNKRKPVYTTANPFLFTGHEVVKQGPLQYRVIGGTITSCRLPHPDWRILASLVTVNQGKATAKNAYFKLLGAPILYLPYVSHPVDTKSRQTGFLIPVIGTSSTKGTVLGESIYWVINRSTDVTVGSQYFSLRGWSPSAELRYRGRGEDFANFHFTALFDRGAPGTHLNQGGQDILFSGRRDFDPEGNTRLVATGEYLSSYVYREAFAESFSLAVASEVASSAYITHNHDGYLESLRFDRYQNFQGISQMGNAYYTPQIRILHLPDLDLDVLDRSLDGTPAVWGFSGSFTGLSRTEPNFSSGYAGRFDLYPHLSVPLHLAGWNFRPEIGARETFYTQSQIPTGGTRIVEHTVANRKDIEADFEVRPPALERDYSLPWLDRPLGGEMRHVIEPKVEYRYVGGIDNFSSIPRFDATDVVSDTNELDYSLTQRLFFRHLHPRPCTNQELPPPTSGVIHVPATYKECGGQSSEWINWTLAAKYFFDPNFGGAVTPFHRNVLDTTLDLTGVAFLGSARNYSPIISRLKVRTSEQTDIEWDADYDTKAGRLNADNIFADYRRGNLFGSFGYATLQALNPAFNANLASQVTKYNLLRLLGGVGNPAKRGLSAGASAGYDYTEDALQYGGLQASYNWDCCGFSIEYRRLALGSVRNENSYSFNFTLAGVGAAGNLKHSEQIF